ncbi:MAG: hypothetical protein JWP40_3539 [Blastococcus sp.]|nr:hypothetical protein [Blastococcus sp.]
MDEDDYIPPSGAAVITKLSPQTLAHMRSRGDGPPYTKLSPGRGGRIRYRRQAVLQWLAERERQPGRATVQ